MKLNGLSYKCLTPQSELVSIEVRDNPGNIVMIIYIQTCIIRSPLGQRKCGLTRQVTS
jgi:hypothetical protein